MGGGCSPSDEHKQASLEDWGFTELYERINHEMEEEAQHADALMRRILMLEGTPRMRPDDLDVGTTVPDMLAADLRLEYKVRAALCKGIELCEQHNDYVTREILRVQLNDTEEDHTYWLEKQLGLIKLVGLENYLQSQFRFPATKKPLSPQSDRGFLMRP